MVLVKNPSPNLSIAGHALMVSDTKIARSNSKVKSAAPLANKPKIRSAIGQDRGLFAGGGLVITRPEDRKVWFKVNSFAESVVDTYCSSLF